MEEILKILAGITEKPTNEDGSPNPKFEEQLATAKSEAEAYISAQDATAQEELKKKLADALAELKAKEAEVKNLNGAIREKINAQEEKIKKMEEVFNKMKAEQKNYQVEAKSKRGSMGQIFAEFLKNRDGNNLKNHVQMVERKSITPNEATNIADFFGFSVGIAKTPLLQEISIIPGDGKTGYIDQYWTAQKFGVQAAYGESLAVTADRKNVTKYFDTIGGIVKNIAFQILLNIPQQQRIALEQSIEEQFYLAIEDYIINGTNKTNTENYWRGLLMESNKFEYTEEKIDNPTRADALLYSLLLGLNKSMQSAMPNIIIVNPMDFFEVFSSKTSTGGYTLPLQNLFPNNLIGGIKVIPSNLVAKDHFYTGAIEALQVVAQNERMQEQNNLSNQTTDICRVVEMLVRFPMAKNPFVAGTFNDAIQQMKKV